ncbi:MAG: MFS transporter [Chloroflexi bacterium]|nr:MFS transporter [Chloroflexota bacterium]
MGVIAWAQERLPRQRVFWAVSVGHFINDTFMSMGPVVLVFLSAAILPMNLAQIGVAVSARQISGALSQPFFGIMGDRTGGRWLGAGGVTWVIVMQTLSVLMAFTGQVWLVLIPFVLAGLGSGAFHPVGASHAADADPDNQGRNTSYFFMFGQLGLGLGPALGGILLQSAKADPDPSAATLIPLYLTALVGLPLLPFMLGGIPRRAAHMAGDAARKAIRAANRLTWRDAAFPLFVVALFVFIRSVAQQGSANFIPVLLEQRGYDPAQYGIVTGLYWISSGIFGVFWGIWADKYGMRRTLLAAMLVGAPTVILLPLTQSLLGTAVVATLSGALYSGTHPLLVVFLQRLMPAGKGLATGLGLGGIFVAGALGSAFYGLLADGPAALSSDPVAAAASTGFGLDATFVLIGVIGLASTLLLFAVPAWAYDRKPSKALPTMETAN